MDAAAPPAERLACTRCIGDAGLRADARSSGFEAECTYCGREGTCVDVAWLADRVHPALQSAFVPVGSDAATSADDDGLATRYDGARATAELAGLDAPVAGDVHRTLVALFRDADGRATYPAEREYVARPARDLPALHRWAAFAAAGARTHAGATDELLDALKWAFAGLDAISTPKGRRAIRVVEAGTRAYFARLAASVEMRTEPTCGGAPDRAGPLNGPGIPALYLARRERTAVTESLAPRGAYVVVTRVRLARAIRVLDLEVAAKALARTGYLDADRTGARLRGRFLADLADALRTSAVQSTADPATRATQRVGDWLAHAASPRVDALLTRAAHAPGRTLTLFAPAATTGVVVGERARCYAVGALRARYRRVSRDAPRTPGPRTPPARD